jgi:hypothetical protein
MLGFRGIAYSTRVDKACSEDQDGNVTGIEPAPGSFATYVTLWECFHPAPTDTGPPETV